MISYGICVSDLLHLMWSYLVASLSFLLIKTKTNIGRGFLYMKKPDNKADIGKKYWIWDLMGTVYVCVQWEGEMKGREEQIFFGSALLYVYAFCSIMQSFYGTEVSSSGFGSQLCHFSIIWTWVNYSFPHWKSQDNTYFSFCEELVENMGFPGGSVDLGNGKTHCSRLAWEIPWTGEPGRLQSMGLQKSQTWLCDWTTAKWRV